MLSLLADVAEDQPLQLPAEWDRRSWRVLASGHPAAPLRGLPVGVFG